MPLFAVPPSAVSSSTPKCLTGRSERTRALAVTAPHKARLLPQTRKRTFGLRDKQSGGREGEDASALQALQHLGRLQRREPKLLDKLGPLQAAEKLAVHGVLSGNTNASPGTQNAQVNIFLASGICFSHFGFRSPRGANEKSPSLVRDHPRPFGQWELVLLVSLGEDLPHVQAARLSPGSRPTPSPASKGASLCS